MTDQPQRESTRLVRVSVNPGDEYQPYGEQDSWMFRVDEERVADQGARFGRAIRNGILAIKAGQKVYAEDLGARPRPPMSAQERQDRVANFRGEVEQVPPRSNLILPPHVQYQNQIDPEDPMAAWEAEMARVEARRQQQQTTPQTTTLPSPPYGTWQDTPPDQSNVEPEDQPLVDDLNREWRQHYQQEWTPPDFTDRREREWQQRVAQTQEMAVNTPVPPTPPVQPPPSYEIRPGTPVHPTHPEFLNAEGYVARNPCGATTVIRLRNRDHIIECQEEVRDPHGPLAHPGLPHLAKIPNTMPGDNVFIGWHREGENS